VDDIIDRCSDLPRRTFDQGSVIVQQGAAFGAILVLVEGRIGIERDGVSLAAMETPGAILGDMSTVLSRPATATMRALDACVVLCADDGAGYLRSRPDVLFDVAAALATRLDNLTGHLADVQRQYGEDDGHLGMLDDVLGTLMHHQPRTVSPGSARLPDPDY
jgi:CRP-like cAMP-binding protein